MSNTRKMYPQLFRAIRDDLRDTQDNQNTIAARHGVSQSIVSQVNAYGTWGNWSSRTKALTPVRSFTTPYKTPSRVEKAEKAGLHPVTHEQRVEAKFAHDLGSIDPSTPLPDPESDPVQSRLNAQFDLIRAARKQLKRLTRTTKIALLISIAALILAVVK